MLLDDTRSPLVFLRMAAEASVPIEHQLEQLLEKETPFVLITDDVHGDHHDEPPEERKQKAIFFKRVKDRMRRYCRGMIVIEGKAAPDLAARAAAAAASKALGFSVQFAPDANRAETIAAAMLAR